MGLDDDLAVGMVDELDDPFLVDAEDDDRPPTIDDRIREFWADVRSAECRLDSQRFTKKLRVMIDAILDEDRKTTGSDVTMKKRLDRANQTIAQERRRWHDACKCVIECHKAFVLHDTSVDRDKLDKHIAKVTEKTRRYE